MALYSLHLCLGVIPHTHATRRSVEERGHVLCYFVECNVDGVCKIFVAKMFGDVVSILISLSGPVSLEVLWIRQ